MHDIFKPTLIMKNGRFYFPKNKNTNKIIVNIQEMKQAELEGVLIREQITTSDTAEFFTQGINKFFLKIPEEADMNWKELFTEIPSKGSGELFPFRDPDVAAGGSHGIIFLQVGEGGEIQFSTVTSGEKYIPNRKWATALPYTSEWIEDGNLGLIEMVTKDFRDSAFDRLAAIHYGIIVGSITSGISRSAAVSGATLDDFIASINAATAIMMRNGCDPTHICGAPEQEAVILHALNDVYRNEKLTDSAKRLTPLITKHFVAGTVYLVQKKRYLISTNRYDLKLDRFKDLLHDAETLVGKFRRGAANVYGNCLRAITGIT